MIAVPIPAGAIITSDTSIKVPLYTPFPAGPSHFAVMTPVATDRTSAINRATKVRMLSWASAVLDDGDTGAVFSIVGELVIAVSPAPPQSRRERMRSSLYGR